MSKDQKKKEELCGKNVDKLIMTCKMINEIKGGLRYWKLDQVWPTNLYYKTLEEVVEILNQVLLSSDFTKEKIWPIINENKTPRSTFNN